VDGDPAAFGVQFERFDGAKMLDDAGEHSCLRCLWD
jgi:hypothetical protein